MRYVDYYSDHSTKVDSLTHVCDRALERLSLPDVPQFDSFACTGVSGLTVAPVLAVMMGKELTIVRKGEKTHSSNKIEGVLDCRYIFIDDFISTGSSMNVVWQTIQHLSPSSKCVGIYLHRDVEFKIPIINKGIWNNDRLDYVRDF